MHLSLRERQAFADIERHLGAEDPELARRLHLISTLAVSPSTGEDEPFVDQPAGPPAALPSRPATVLTSPTRRAPRSRPRTARRVRPHVHWRSLLMSVVVLAIVGAALTVAFLSPRPEPGTRRHSLSSDQCAPAGPTPPARVPTHAC